jgi:hypothetical protein
MTNRRAGGPAARRRAESVECVVSGMNATSLNGQSAPARGPSAVESAIGFGRHHPPPPANPPRRRIGDESAATTRDDDGAEPRPTRTLLLIDDVRLRRECLFHLLSAELSNFDVLAFATTQPPETWATAFPDIVLASAPSSVSDDGLPIGEIVAAASGAPVLLLTESDSDDDVPAVDEPGVAGRFPTACGSDLLIAAIQLVLAGGRFQIPARAAGKTAWRPHSGAPG